MPQRLAIAQSSSIAMFVLAVVSLPAASHACDVAGTPVSCLADDGCLSHTSHADRDPDTFAFSLRGSNGSLLRSGPASGTGDVVVHVFNFEYAPDPTIFVGDTVEWVWDEFVHSVTSVTGSAEVFDSEPQVPPFSFTHTFTQAGVYNYYCTLHGVDNGDGTAVGMAGTVTVLPVPEPAAMGMAGVVGFAFLARRRG
jgi:plastocyanin